MSDSSWPQIQAERIGRRAYQILYEKIVSREFLFGERLDLDAIQRQLGISRTPLREAIARLEVEGLVETKPRSGTFVTNPSVRDVAEAFEVRHALEISAVESGLLRATEEDIDRLTRLVEQMHNLITENEAISNYIQYVAIDHEFHAQIVSLAGNKRLSLAHNRENVHAQMARVRYRRAEREWRTAQNEHEQILNAIKSKDVQATKAALDAHLQRALRSIVGDMVSAANDADPARNGGNPSR